MTSNDLIDQCTVVLEAGSHPSILATKLNQIFAQGSPYPAKIVAVFPPHLEAKLPAEIPDFPKSIQIIGFSGSFSDLKDQIATPFLAYLPANAPYSRPLL